MKITKITILKSGPIDLLDFDDAQKFALAASNGELKLNFLFVDVQSDRPLTQYGPGQWGVDFTHIKELAKGKEGIFFQFAHDGDNLGKNVVNFALMDGKGERQFSQVNHSGTLSEWLIVHELGHSFCAYLGIPDFVHQTIEDNGNMAEPSYVSIIKKFEPYYSQLEGDKPMEFKFPLKRRVPILPSGGFNTMRSYGKHNAQDYRASYEPIYAPADGEVKNSSSKIGGILCNFYAKDYRFLFAHCSKVIKTGPVKKGEQVAVSGNTGTETTSPHAHLFISYQDEPIDPLTFNFEGDDNMYSLPVWRNSKGEISLIGKGVRVPISFKVWQLLGKPEFSQVTDDQYNSIPAGQALAGSQNLGEIQGEAVIE